jgi:hypothetical protein
MDPSLHMQVTGNTFNQIVQRPGDITNSRPATHSYLFDTGSTWPQGLLSDIQEIDPNGRLPAPVPCNYETASGTITNHTFRVHIAVNSPQDEVIMRYRSTYFSVANDSERLSGLSIMNYTYLAKGPGPIMYMSNTKTAAVKDVVGRRGDT